MSDPLSLVRKATISSTPIDNVANHYVFGSLKLPELTKTAFRRTLKADDYCYTLRDIIIFLENVDVPISEYRRTTVEKRVSAIVETDRAALTNYLTGVIDTCPQIDTQAVASYVPPIPDSASGLKSTVPVISSEKMQEQRERHAALLEKTILKVNTVTIVSDKNSSGIAQDDLHSKNKKRKYSLGEDIDEELKLDKGFLEADARTLAELRADELPALTRSSVFNASGTDFTFALKLFNEKVLKPKQQQIQSSSTHATSSKSASSTNTSSATAFANNTNKDSDTAATNGTVSGNPRNYPIIVLPSAVTSCITTVNVKDFLIDGMYFSSEEKRKQLGVSFRKEKELLLIRVMPNNTRNVYRVVDDPTKLLPIEWDRVVAVFATGQQWQFKGWKYSSPVELFQHVLGVHVTVDDRAVDATILSWNCKILKINLFKQHLNAGTAKEFWLYLDDYIRLKKPALLIAQQKQQQRNLAMMMSPPPSQHHHHHQHSSSSHHHHHHRTPSSTTTTIPTSATA